jgi:hypothetical protein
LLDTRPGFEDEYKILFFKPVAFKK